MFRLRRRRSDSTATDTRPADALRQIHNLVVELTRTGIEVKNLKMRVESLAGRLEFNERRARALESAVVYKPSTDERPPRQSQQPPSPPAGRSKRELAVEVGTLLAAVALRNSDRVGLLLFSDRAERYLPPRAGREHLLRVIRELVSAEPVRARTDVGEAVRFLRNVTKKHAVVFLLSDFLDTEFSAPLRRLAQKHDVIALTLNDPRELDLPRVGVIALEDAETGRVELIDTARAAVRDSYSRSARERRIERRRTFARMAVDAVDLSTDRPFVPLLQALFNARSRRH